MNEALLLKKLLQRVEFVIQEMQKAPEGTDDYALAMLERAVRMTKQHAVTFKRA